MNRLNLSFSVDLRELRFVENRIRIARERRLGYAESYAASQLYVQLLREQIGRGLK